MTEQIQVKRVADFNGQPAFVVVIDGNVHFAYRDPEPEHPNCCDRDGCLNGEHPTRDEVAK